MFSSIVRRSGSPSKFTAKSMFNDEETAFKQEYLLSTVKHGSGRTGLGLLFFFCSHMTWPKDFLFHFGFMFSE